MRLRTVRVRQLLVDLRLLRRRGGYRAGTVQQRKCKQQARRSRELPVQSSPWIFNDPAAGLRWLSLVGFGGMRCIGRESQWRLVSDLQADHRLARLVVVVPSSKSQLLIATGIALL